MIPGTTAGKSDLNEPLPMKMTRIIAAWVGFQKSSALIRTLFLMSLFLTTGVMTAGCAVVGPDYVRPLKNAAENTG
jgi:uncharacterized membrane protein YccC